MEGWNYADLWEVVAEELPEAEVLVQGDRSLTWRGFDRRANALAGRFLRDGLPHQAKVAVYLYNCPEWLETVFACFKVSMVPINVNYRYGPDEIAYLFDDCDADAVVFHASFMPLLEEIRDRFPAIKAWYVVPDGEPEPDWAVRYDEFVSSGTDRPSAPWERSGDDLHILYTGGTTGFPKGVMYRQHDLFLGHGGGGIEVLGIPPVSSMEEFRSRVTQPGPRAIPAAPLMHGSGQWGCFHGLNIASTIVLLESRTFDPEELFRTVERQRVNIAVIVGDAFARPMVEWLERNPGRYDLSTLQVMGSSGAMWSQPVKEALLRHLPDATLFDSLGSTEALRVGGSVGRADASPGTATFMLRDGVKVLKPDGTPVEPGSGEAGMVAVSGHIPVGYYNDPEKTAQTFPTFGGVRYSIPGDWATVDADGTLHLLGRGSVCINTGGEKVFPEEVEEVLKEHPSVRDAVCVGVPDERFGEAITAVVEPRPGAAVDEAKLKEHVKHRLASYKAPRHVVPVESIARSPSGKADYRGLREQAVEALGLTTALRG